MRHNKKFNHLSRKKAHRDALLANMTISLIEHKRIVTTLAKAKALRGYAEHLINVAQRGLVADAKLAEGWTNADKPAPKDQSSRRLVFKYLNNKHAVTELFGVVAPKVGDRPGGYTRILKLGNRLGDNAKTCFIELVDFNEAMLEAKAQETGAKKKTTRRSRRSTKKVEAPAAEAPAQAEE
ncbi:MAG: 50S ribosomal protein L17 [Muribaculaceae bacterium]|nr:50S ribosomal protein L17 [Muribaculaceae bacterium]